MNLAVLVPTLNEQEQLPGLLDSLARQTVLAERVVVADGGSTDRTSALAAAWGAEVVAVTGAGRGRGGQLAEGLTRITQEVVLIAHADMRLPATAVASVLAWLRDHPDCPGGCLGHRFDRRTLGLRLVEWADAWRARRGLAYGDQAQFFHRDWLARVGGFPDQPLMEDVELSLRLRRLGRPAYLEVPVIVSARRFARLGWARTLWINWRIRRRYRRDGVAAAGELYRYYYQPDERRSVGLPQPG
jgi:rSAM/selenodomain-associated transferase 2